MAGRINEFACAVAVLGLTSPLAPPARAEIKMPELNGEWRGSGTDRELPVQSLRPASCKASMRADLTPMACDMVCEGEGQRKTITLRATLDGELLSGTVTQRITRPGEAPSELDGTMTGRREGDKASFVVRWSGWQPATSVALTLVNPNSFSMHVAALGITMMDVVFTRAGKR
jgi:hypothetical protein